VADFLLLLYSTSSFDRAIKDTTSQYLWSVKPSMDYQDFTGPHLSEHALPPLVGNRDLSEGCYCVEQANFLTSTAISTTASPGSTATTPWTPATTANTTENAKMMETS